MLNAQILKVATKETPALH